MLQMVVHITSWKLYMAGATLHLLTYETSSAKDAYHHPIGVNHFSTELDMFQIAKVPWSLRYNCSLICGKSFQTKSAYIKHVKQYYVQVKERDKNVVVVQGMGIFVVDTNQLDKTFSDKQL